MAAARWRAADSVAEHLLDRGHDFEFFQAVRLLLRLMPGRRSVGTDSKPNEEVVRFESRVSLEFPASAIHEIERNPAGGGPPRMTVNFMGLMGTQGVLPFFYTEHMMRRRAAKDTSMEAFFNLFNHRWISIFYRAWEKYRLPIAYERSALERRSSGRISHFLYDLIGFGTEGLRGDPRLKVHDEVLLYYAGFLTQRPRNAVNLQMLLGGYFGVAVSVLQCIGAWYSLGPDERCRLEGRGSHNQLGDGAVAGAQVWDQQSRFRIRLGPLDLKQFRSFLPGGRANEEMNSLTRLFVGPTLAFEVQLVLKKTEVPRLGLEGAAALGLQLGLSTWLKTEEMGRDPDDTILLVA